MSLRASVLQLLQDQGPLTDAQLRELTGARSHQHVNQVCRRLCAEGAVRRDPGPEGRLLNTLTGLGPVAVRPSRQGRAATQPPPDAHAGPVVVPALDDGGVLVVLPCSARKREAGQTGPSTGRLVEELPTAVGGELQTARADLHRRMPVDLRSPAAAIERYDGELYRAVDRRRLAEARCSVVVLSGGYGIVDATEAIGDYNRELDLSDWSAGVLERSLVAVTRARRVHTVVGFLAASTSYATAFRRAAWQELDGVRVVLVSVAAGGSTGTTPRALGEALMASMDGPLLPREWRAASGLSMTLSTLARSRVAPMQHVDAAIDALRDHRRARRPGQLRADDPVWRRPGLYAWWVDEAGARDLGGVGVPSSSALAYLGQTGATAWPSGRQRSTTLGQRVRGNHLRGNVQGSTFRRTLASLLVGSGAFGGWSSEGESDLSTWMERHLRVAVWPYDDRDRLADLESRILDALDPPLNLEGRGASNLRTRIAEARAQFAARTRP